MYRIPTEVSHGREEMVKIPKGILCKTVQLLEASKRSQRSKVSKVYYAKQTTYLNRLTIHCFEIFHTTMLCQRLSTLCSSLSSQTPTTKSLPWEVAKAEQQHLRSNPAQLIRSYLSQAKSLSWIIVLPSIFRMLPKNANC